MAPPRKKTTAGETVPCPQCNGLKVVPGGRYTEPERVCPRCGGEGVVAKHEVGREPEEPAAA